MNKRILLGVFFGFIGLVNFVFAGGIEIREVGARADALGGAFRAVADDGTAVFWNPAGLTQVNNQAVTFEAPLIQTKAKITQSYYDASVLPGYNTGETIQKKSWELVPTFAYAIDFKNKLKMGLGVYVQHGLGTEFDFFSDPVNYPDYPEYDWTSKGEFLSIHPALAKQINERVSVGIGVFATKGDMEQRGIVVDTTTFAALGISGIPVDSFMKGDGWGYGGNIGVLCKVNNEFTWGLTYRSATKVRLSGNTEVNAYTPLGVMTETSPSSTNIALPANVGFGLAYRPLPDFMLSTDIDWTEWSSFDRSIIENDNGTPAGMIKPTSTMVNDWENTIRYSLGFKYNLKNNMNIYGGYFMDPTPIPDKTLTPWVPDSGTKNAFDFGIGYETERFEVICGYEYQAAASRTVAGAPQDVDGDTVPDNLPGNYTLKTSTIRLGANILF